MQNIIKSFDLCRYPSLLKAMKVGDWLLDLIMAYVGGRLLAMIAEGGASFLSANNVVSTVVAIAITEIIKKGIVSTKLAMQISIVMSIGAAICACFMEMSPMAAIGLFMFLNARGSILVKYNMNRSSVLWGNDMSKRDQFSLETSNVSRVVNLVGGAVGVFVAPSAIVTIVAIVAVLAIDQGLDLWAHKKLNLAEA